MKNHMSNIICLFLIGIASIPCNIIINYSTKSFLGVYAFVGYSLYAIICGIAMYYMEKTGDIIDIVCIVSMIILIYIYMNNSIAVDNVYVYLIIQVVIYYICNVVRKR